MTRRAGVQSDFATWFVLRVLGPVLRLYYRPTINGFERLPDDGAFMLVSNHNAGMGIAEIVSFAWLYLRQDDPRPLAGFAHPLGLTVWPFSWLLAEVGAVPSTYDAAYATLGKGVPLMVYPGGDYDTMRPFWLEKRVDFNGRLGFLRIIRKSGVPMVPIGITGSHFTAPILWRARFLAWLFVLPRLVGIKRWGLSLTTVLATASTGVLAALGSAPIWLPLGVFYIIGATPLAYIPWVPWTIRFRVGTPIPTEELFDGSDTEEELERALETVESTIEGLLNNSD